MPSHTDRSIALWYKKISPLNELASQDSTKIQALVSEIEALLHDINQKNQGDIASASGFLIVMGLQKLFVMGDETIKENICALYLMRFRTDPQYLGHENQRGIAYANAPLFLIITRVLRHEDLFRHEPHASLLQQLTAAVSDASSYWIKKEDIIPVVSRENAYAGNTHIFFASSPQVKGEDAQRTPSPFTLEPALTPDELERQLGLS